MKFNLMLMLFVLLLSCQPDIEDIEKSSTIKVVTETKEVVEDEVIDVEDEAKDLPSDSKEENPEEAIDDSTLEEVLIEDEEIIVDDIVIEDENIIIEEEIIMFNVTIIDNDIVIINHLEQGSNFSVASLVPQGDDIFVEWTVNDSTIEEDFFVVESETVIKAIYREHYVYNIVFNTLLHNSDGTMSFTQEVVEGNVPAEVDDPIKNYSFNHYLTFGGWFTCFDTMQEFDSTEIVNEDIEVFAKWIYPDNINVGDTRPVELYEPFEGVYLQGVIVYENPNYLKDGYRYLEALINKDDVNGYMVYTRTPFITDLYDSNNDNNITTFDFIENVPDMWVKDSYLHIVSTGWRVASIEEHDIAENYWKNNVDDYLLYPEIINPNDILMTRYLTRDTNNTNDYISIYYHSRLFNGKLIYVTQREFYTGTTLAKRDEPLLNSSLLFTKKF